MHTCGVRTTHNLSVQKDGRKPYLNLHNRTENLVGFLNQIPFVSRFGCLDRDKLDNATQNFWRELPCFTPDRLRL